jgi:N-acyl-D-aspartate/D-glutamate deacylase
MGLSINHFDRDRTLRPLPGFFAEDDEFRALLAVLAQHPPATMQVITRFNDREKDVTDAERFAGLAREAGVRAQWPGIPFNVRDDDHRPALWDAHHRLQAEGADFWPNVAFKPIAPFFSFERSLVFQRVPVWNDWVNGPEEDKLRLLADPAWRDRARESWDNRTHSSLSRIDRPDEMILSLSETGAGPVGISLAAYAGQQGLHISDALAQWVLLNGIHSLMLGTPERLSETDIVAALRESRTLANINDSGAHLQLFAGAGEHIYLLSHYVRDAGLLSIEEAVHALTGRTASFFGLGDRGVLAPGKVGDLVVFSLEEIELGEEERRYDVPHGTWRLARKPAGFRATICAGVPTWLGGGSTGARPGGFLRPTA